MSEHGKRDPGAGEAPGLAGYDGTAASIHGLVAGSKATGIWVVDEDERTLFANEAMARMLGCSLEELRRSTVVDFLFDEDFGAARLARERRDAGAREPMPMRLRRKDGSAAWLNVTAEPLLDAAGRRAGTIAMHMDASGHHAEDEALRGSERRFAAVFERSTVALALMRMPSGEVTAANAAFLALFGRERHEVVGIRAQQLDLVDAPTRDRLRAAYEAQGPVCDFECDGVDRAGVRHRLSIDLVPLRIAGADHVLTMVHDVTDVARQQEALRASEERLRLALEASGAGAWAYDLRSGCTTWDARYHAMYEFPAGMAPAPEAWLERLHPQDRERMQARLDRIFATPGDDDWSVEFRAVLPSGRVAWMQSLGRVHRDAAGAVLRVDGINLDVTARKQAEMELRAARDALRRTARLRELELRQRGDQLVRMASELTLTAQHERERLAAVLHDELQQLLVGAKFGVEELLARGSTAQQRAAEERLAALVKRAIAVSRTLTSELNPPVLHEPGLLAVLQWLARWMHGLHGLDVQLDAEAEFLIEREDVRVLVFQSIREALLNVVKHASTKAARVTVRRDDDLHLRVAISDSGPGFDPAALDDDAQSLLGHFGLASIEERLGLLGGEMLIESAPGEGTTVILRLPVDGAVAWAAGRDAQGVRERPAAPLHRERVGPLRVLLADGHTLARRGLAALLSARADVQVVGEAADGLQTLALAERLRPDAVVLSVAMHGLGGVQAARRLHRAWPSMRIVGLAHGPAERVGSVMLKAGAAAVVDADADVDALLEAIREPRGRAERPARRRRR